MGPYPGECDDIYLALKALFGLAENAFLDRPATPRTANPVEARGVVKGVSLRPKGELVVEVVFPGGGAGLWLAENVTFHDA